MTDKIPCPHCNGKGHTLLSGVYAETLRILRQRTKRGRYVVANRDAGEWFDCKPTALNNRLKRLEDLGFAKSEFCGLQRRFVAT